MQVYKTVYSICIACLFVDYIIRVLVRRGGLFTVRLFNMLLGSLFGFYSRILDEYEHRVAENYRVPVRKGAGLVYLFGVYICSRLRARVCHAPAVLML